jgi:hypothetical protein
MHARDPGGQTVRVEISAGGIARTVVIEAQSGDAGVGRGFGAMPQCPMGADRLVSDGVA